MYIYVCIPSFLIREWIGWPLSPIRVLASVCMYTASYRGVCIDVYHDHGTEADVRVTHSTSLGCDDPRPDTEAEPADRSASTPVVSRRFAGLEPITEPQC